MSAPLSWATKGKDKHAPAINVVSLDFVVPIKA
jgi:hypothetical protein